MKKTIGIVLCIVAILRIISLLLPAQPGAETSAHLIQDWALVGVILAFGIALSAAKNPEKSAKP